MNLTIAPADPLGPESAALIAESEATLAAEYPPEQRFGFSPQALVDAGALFFVASLDGAPVGCGAIAPMANYAEVKRVFVRASAHRQGVARAIMARLEEEARRLGCGALRLETGVKQAAALALYRSLDYLETGRFGDYPDCPTSVYMMKTLS